MDPQNTFFVCTHHRCGTVLMLNVFRRYSHLTGQVFFKGPLAEAPEDTAILQDAHSRSKLPEDASGLHLMRDPFDMLLSHIRYHETTKSPNEVPNKKVMDDGRLYREHLIELPTLGEKAAFEIDNVYGRTLRSMLKWDYGNDRFHNYPLDTFLDLPATERVVRDLSASFPVFEGELKALTTAFSHVVKATHIRERHGTRVAGERAKDVLPRAVVERIYAEFPGADALEERVAAFRVPA